ncbi:MAG: NAD(P)-dependent oxidoreductase [Spirochaetales bacterium]|nr:NAD(P)-dependent oxidoreductase [Spirochaetales bacterium]
MNIFVTGGTGFIGSYVVKRLSDAGHSITILARNPDKVPALHTLAGVSIIPGLLTDFHIIEKHMHEKDACIHIALGWGDIATSMLKNDTFPSVFIFETAARAGVKHLIYTSSTAATGNNPHRGKGYRESEPVTYYGATKAASEQYLYAVSHMFPIRCNIIRPGYTFGNPVIPGAYIESDNRFRHIAAAVKKHHPLTLTKHDGTQFIWAGDLAKVYEAVLASNVNRECYFCLGSEYITWEAIAFEAITMTGSSTSVILEDKGYDEQPLLFDVESIKAHFGLSFSCRQKIREHLEFLIETV